jgi:hypothetical protein
MLGLVLVAGGAGGIARADSSAKDMAKLPSGARLIATSQLDEVRSFPEQSKDKHVRTEDTVGMGAVDNVYETDRAYKDAVGYYDGMVKDGALTEVSRKTTRTSTAWELKMKGGAYENVIVRNTRPTTIETVQAGTAFERDRVSAPKTP